MEENNTTIQPVVSPFLSQKFKFFSFLAMVLLVYVHAYNLNFRYLQPFTLTFEKLTFNGYFQYFLSNGLFRFRIPILFIISAYLFALNDNKPYKERTLKRLRTLGIPYFVWSLTGFLVTLAFENFDLGRAGINDAQLAPYLSASLEPNDRFWLWFERLVANPIPFQLWFIRALLLLNLLYPGLKWLIVKWPKTWLGIISIAWLLYIDFIPFIPTDAILFFSLGMYFAKYGIGLETPPKWYKTIIFSLLFLVSVGVKSYLAFYFTSYEMSFGLPMLLLHKLCIVSGALLFWFESDKLVRFCMNQKAFQWLVGFSFIIFALHVPLLNYTIIYFFNFFKSLHSAHFRLLTYIVQPICLIAFCVLVGFLLRSLLPKIYGIMTGGRGMA